MPQSYGHGGNGTTVETYAKILGGGTAKYDRIVFGLRGEGFLDPAANFAPDNPEPYAKAALDAKAAGIFSWRLDTDSMPKKPDAGQPEGDDQLPTFAVATNMWDLV